MKDLKVVFMGTPEFSVNVLKKLIENTNVIGVVSQPDKPQGRKKILKETPVKKVALENNIKVFQPKNIKENYEEIINLKPDIIITCAYGQIIGKELLSYPKYKCINVHASLLPKLRGGAPIHKAIINGYKKTGITIMNMDLKMDSGDILKQEEIEIKDYYNTSCLHDKLSLLGANLLIETLKDLLKNNIIPVKQDITKVTYAWNIKREEEKIDFSKTTIEIHNQIRGLSRIPGAYGTLEGKNIKIYESIKGIDNSKVIPGTIINANKNGIEVKTKDGKIIIKELQVPGKKPIMVKDYMNGIKQSDLIGKVFK